MGQSPALPSPPAFLPNKPWVIVEIQCGIQVSICHEATGTRKYPLAEWQTVSDHAALETHLAGREPAVGKHDMHACCLSFVRQHPAKGAKAHIADSTGE